MYFRRDSLVICGLNGPRAPHEEPADNLCESKKEQFKTLQGL